MLGAGSWEGQDRKWVPRKSLSGLAGKFKFECGFWAADDGNERPNKSIEHQRHTPAPYRDRWGCMAEEMKENKIKNAFKNSHANDLQ